MDVTDRVVSVITYLSLDRDFHGITEICTQLRISKSTVYRILSSLERHRWVAQDTKTRRYRLGNGILEIGLSILSNLDTRSVSLPYLYQLRDTTSETASLSLRVGLERTYVEIVQGSEQLRLIHELGKRHPLWCAAQGKAILAYMDEGEIEAVLNNLINSGVRAFASGQIIDIDNLRKELTEIRKKGFSVSFGERIAGTAAVAAPIFGAYDKVIGSIATGGPANRLSADAAKHYGTLVSRIAREVSLELGAFVKEPKPLSNEKVVQLK